jgi:hypothetical protein
MARSALGYAGKLSSKISDAMKLEIHFPSELRVQLAASPDANNNAILKLLEQIDMKASEVPAALGALKAQLAKAKDEIINKIAALEVADPDLSEEGTSALGELRDLVQQLDNINPDAIPPGTPVPAPVEPTPPVSEPPPAEPTPPVPPEGEPQPPA